MLPTAASIDIEHNCWNRQKFLCRAKAIAWGPRLANHDLKSKCAQPGTIAPSVCPKASRLHQRARAVAQPEEPFNVSHGRSHKILRKWGPIPPWLQLRFGSSSQGAFNMSHLFGAACDQRFLRGNPPSLDKEGHTPADVHKPRCGNKPEDVGSC